MRAIYKHVWYKLSLSPVKSGEHFERRQPPSRKKHKYLQMAFWQMRILASISAGKVRSRAQGQKGLVHICTKTFVPGIFFLFTMAISCPVVTPCSGVRLDKQEQEMWRVEGVQGIGWGDGDAAHSFLWRDWLLLASGYMRRDASSGSRLPSPNVGRLFEKPGVSTQTRRPSLNQSV